MKKFQKVRITTIQFINIALHIAVIGLGVSKDVDLSPAKIRIFSWWGDDHINTKSCKNVQKTSFKQFYFISTIFIQEIWN